MCPCCCTSVLGTFRPVKEEDVADHHMHSEYYEVTPEQAAGASTPRRARGGRIVCVGTTSVRTLETVATEDGVVHPGSGFTQIFITPGVKIKAVDALITNFHLPQSTLLMLISALMGRENALDVYRQAVEERYRFFSFGDAMMITGKPAKGQLNPTSSRICGIAIRCFWAYNKARFTPARAQTQRSEPSWAINYSAI